MTNEKDIIDRVKDNTERLAEMHAQLNDQNGM